MQGGENVWEYIHIGVNCDNTLATGSSNANNNLNAPHFFTLIPSVLNYTTRHSSRKACVLSRCFGTSLARSTVGLDRMLIKQSSFASMY